MLNISGVLCDGYVIKDFIWKEEKFYVIVM